MAGMLSNTNIQCLVVAHCRVTTSPGWKTVGVNDPDGSLPGPIDFELEQLDSGWHSFDDHRLVVSISIKNHGGEAIYVSFGPTDPGLGYGGGHLRIDGHEAFTLPAYGHGVRLKDDEPLLYIIAETTGSEEVTIVVELAEV